MDGVLGLVVYIGRRREVVVTLWSSFGTLYDDVDGAGATRQRNGEYVHSLLVMKDLSPNPPLLFLPSPI